MRVRVSLSAPVKHHRAIIEPKRLGELLRAIDTYQGQPASVAALKLTPLLFVRPGELRHAHWADIDLDAQLWCYSAAKTKQAHIAPLARQSIEILEALW